MNLQQHLRSERALRLAGLVACGVLLFLVGFAICPSAQENEANATTGQATPATTSVTLSVEDDPLSFDLKPISSDGTFAESTTMTITASTNSFSGYTLSIAAQSGDNTTKLINTDTEKCPVTETKCSIASLSGVVTKNAYADPVDSTAVEAVRNTWGFSPSEYLDGETSIDNSATDGTEKYLPISTTATNLAKTIAANNDVPNTYTMKIGARVDSNIAMGTYENTFVIAAVGNGAAYTINYADNSGEATGMPGVQTGMTPDIIVELSGDQPSRVGYDFAGWCSVNNADNVFSCGGNIYQPGGSFGIDQTSENSITLYAIWEEPCPTNTICYKANGANVGENDPKMDNQTANYNENTNPITSNMAVNLWPVNFKYDINGDGYNDYGFAGWSEDKNAATAINATNNKPTIYGPMQNITTGDLSANGMKLYAVWVPVAKDKDGNELTFQTGDLLTTRLTETVGDTLANKPNEYITALRDERDSQVYAVAKLKDGNYWMIENLRLESEGTVGNNINDPNVTNQSLAQGYGGTPGTYGSFVGLASAESNYFAYDTTSNTIYKSDGANTTYDPSTSPATLEDIGTGGDSGYRMPRYRNTNTSSPASSPTDGNANIYSYGNYYTWAAAIADTTYYGSTNGHTTVATSICPKGWHLPYGNSGSTSPNLGNTSGGFYYLGVQLGATSKNGTSSKKWRSFPNNFLYSGNANNSNISWRGSYGYYWSSSAYDADYAYSLLLYSSLLSPGTDRGKKFLGFPVRCVVAPSP